MQLNSFYIKFDSKHFYYLYINTITNWRVSLSKICHEWPNNAVTQECASAGVSFNVIGSEQHIFDNETRQLVIVFIIYIKKCFESNLI